MRKRIQMVLHISKLAQDRARDRTDQSGTWPWTRGLHLRFATVSRSALALCFCATPVVSQQVDPSLWGTDGVVTAIARVGNTVYVGGSFTMVGPNTGGGVPLDRHTGDPLAPFPRVTGVVNVVIPDKAGGWYIGGSFIAVGGLPRTNLAHILSGGRVADWFPNPDEEVSALSLKAPLRIP